MDAGYMAVVLLLIFAMYSVYNRRDYIAVRRAAAWKRKGRRAEMQTLAKQFIGKDCLLYTFNGNRIAGRVLEVTEHGLLLQTGDTTEVVNLDFIIRLRKHPTDKKGKKKSVVLD